MKVLVIVTSHFGYDGISNVATNYYVYQDHSKIKMDLVTINKVPDNLENEMKHNGDCNIVLSQRNKNPFSYIYTLTNLIRKNCYDIVHVHGNSNTMCIELLAAKLGKCKTRIAHSHNTKCNHPFINKILRLFFKISYTDGFACGIEAGEWLFNKSEVTIIANGVDLNRFTLSPQYRVYIRKEWNVTDRIVIGHVGRFSEQKNHRKLLSIFSCIKKMRENVTLLMWGDGDLYEQTKVLAEHIGGDIRFMGTSNEIEKCLHAVDVIIFPSLFEGLPLFLIEAQALGLPCLLSNTISPMAKICDYVYYESLNSPDEKWAKDALQIVSTSTIEKNSITSHECIRKAGYDIRIQASKLIEIYHNLINKNNG